MARTRLVLLSALPSVVAALPASVLLLTAGDRLPARLATHFGPGGAADGCSGFGETLAVVVGAGLFSAAVLGWCAAGLAEEHRRTLRFLVGPVWGTSVFVGVVAQQAVAANLDLADGSEAVMPDSTVLLALAAAVPVRETRSAVVMISAPVRPGRSTRRRTVRRPAPPPRYHQRVPRLLQQGRNEEVEPISHTPLAGVTGWSSEQVQRLAEVWITTAEQVVALAATPGGVTSLAQQLGTAEHTVDDLLERARAAVPPERRAELDTPVDPSEFGTGALPPRPEEGRPD